MADVSRETAASTAVLDVSRETRARIEAFVALLRDENARQNLVSRSSLDEIWDRHIADSAQLLRFVPSPTASWLDLGTGAGFPGLIVALLHNGPVTLVEARRLRVEFLREAAAVLGVEDRVEIVHARIETVPPRTFDAISARAFAPLDRLLALGSRFSTEKTRWILPKGRNAQSELDAARKSWQGDYRLEPSLTDADARIVVAEGIAAKPKGRKRR